MSTSQLLAEQQEKNDASVICQKHDLYSLQFKNL